MKWIIRGGITLVLVVVLVLLGAYMYLDVLAKTAVERGGTYAMGVQTDLDSASIEPFRGEVGMSGLKVHNPEGFKSDHFMYLGDMNVSVSMGSLMGEKVVVPKVHLKTIDLNLEDRDGKMNYQTILDNLAKLSGPAEEQPPAQKEGKKYVINEVLVEDIKVKAAVLPSLGDPQTLTIEIPQIRLTDVGSDSENGVVLSQVMGTITNAILKAVVEQAGDVLPGAIAGSLKDGVAKVGDLGGAAIDMTGESAAKIIESTGKIGEQLGEGVKDVGSKAGEAVDGIGKGLGGLFGGKKEEEKKTEE